MNKLDIQALKDNVNLIDIVRADLGQRGKPAGKGRNFFCPFHDNTRTEALTVYRDGYKCQSCGASGDVIGWLKEHKKLTFKESIQYLGGTFNGETRIERRPVPPPQPKEAPIKDWQAFARDVVDQTTALLWDDPIGERALAWLQGPERRLAESSIRAWDLGYSPGMKINGQWIERGIIIPTAALGIAWALNIRRPAGTPKYRKVTGSKTGIFGIETLIGLKPGFTVFITEGEFDAMQLWHVIAYHDELNAGVITTGGNTNRLDPVTWGQHFIGAGQIIAAYDLDKAGQSGFDKLAQLSGRVRRAQLPAAINGEPIKDITDYVKAGGDLLAWTNYQLEAIQ